MDSSPNGQVQGCRRSTSWFSFSSSLFLTSPQHPASLSPPHRSTHRCQSDSFRIKVCPCHTFYDIQWAAVSDSSRGEGPHPGTSRGGESPGSPRRPLPLLWPGDGEAPFCCSPCGLRDPRRGGEEGASRSDASSDTSTACREKDASVLLPGVDLLHLHVASVITGVDVKPLCPLSPSDWKGCLFTAG